MALVSIVVPVFNVEKYLSSCIESILRQTLRDFELILVNDGSTDGCGEICEQYTRQDCRVRVIHKTNGGLADARNAGIKAASAQWIAFIDSDDVINPFMFEIMINAGNRFNTPIVCCRFHHFKDDCDILNEMTNSSSDVACNPRILQGMSMFEWYLQSSGADSACNKIYRRDLFEGISFPVGKINEDSFTTYKLLDKAQQICILQNQFYYYRNRPNSIMRSNFSVRRLDAVEAISELYCFIKQKYPRLKKNASERLILCVIRIIDDYIWYCKNPEDEVYCYLYNILLHNYFTLLQSKHLSLMDKLVKTPILFGKKFYAKMTLFRHNKKV